MSALTRSLLQGLSLLITRRRGCFLGNVDCKRNLLVFPGGPKLEAQKKGLFPSEWGALQSDQPSADSKTKDETQGEPDMFGNDIETSKAV